MFCYKKYNQQINLQTSMLNIEIHALFEPGLEILLSRADPVILNSKPARLDINPWPLGLVLMLIQPTCNYEMRTQMELVCFKMIYWVLNQFKFE